MTTFVHNLFRMHACTYFNDHFKENKFVLSVESSKAVGENNGLYSSEH